MSTATPVPKSIPAYGDLQKTLTALVAGLKECEASPQLSGVLRLGEVRRELASTVAKEDKRQQQAPWVREVLDGIRRAARIGALDLPLVDEDRDRLAGWEKQGWPGLLASMLLTAAWRWSSAPTLAQVPDWMWGDYSEWLFASPNSLITSEDCAIYALHVERHTEELARWAERNAASPTIKAAIDAFLKVEVLAPFRHVKADVRVAAEARARILRRLYSRAVPVLPLEVFPRAGRTFRVGLLARSWDLQPDTGAALAQMESWEAERVERVLFSCSEPSTAFGWHCRDKAREFHLIPGGVPEAAQVLRDARLDALVLIGDTIPTDVFSALSLFRLAPLQVQAAQSAVTSGSPEIDLRIAQAGLRGANARAYSEPMLVVPEGASTFALRRGEEAELEYSRENLGFPAGTVIIGTVFPTVHAAAETLPVLTAALVAAPNARLLVHVLPDANLPAVGLERFSAVVEATLAQSGFSADRIVVLAPEQASHDESRAILRLADFLIAAPGTAFWSAQALAAGIPVLAREGAEVEWMKALGYGELMADDLRSWVQAAAKLAQDPASIATMREELKQRLANGLPCADTLAAGDVLLAAIEAAFDLMQAQGHKVLRRSSSTLLATAAEADILAAEGLEALAAGDVITAQEKAVRALTARPCDAKLRVLYGRAQLALGRAERASTYLLAALDELGDDATLWHDLATAFRLEGKNAEAIKALESSLRLSPGQPEGWLLLIELAEGVGAFDIAHEAFDALKATAPDHPQIPELAPRFQS